METQNKIKCKEDEKISFETSRICCDKPMAYLGDVNYLSQMNIDTTKRWLCLECGGFVDITEGQLDDEELVNDVNAFCSEEQKQEFLKHHPEFKDEVD
jgi:hypothetical protein